MQIAKRIAEVKNKQLGYNDQRAKYLGFDNGSPKPPPSMNINLRNQFFFECLKRNEVIAKRLTETKSNLPDKEGLKQLVQQHDYRAALVSRY